MLLYANLPSAIYAIILGNFHYVNNKLMTQSVLILTYTLKAFCSKLIFNCVLYVVSDIHPQLG